MLVHFFSSEDWQSWGLGGQPLIPERMPVLIDDDFLFEDGYGPRATRVVNTWLRTLPSSGAPSPNSWRAYALSARDWLTHLRRHAIEVFASRQDLVAALGTYADRRLSGPLDERLASSSWELQVTVLSRFYAWAVEEGLASAVPFTVGTGIRMVEGRLVETGRNLARLRRVKPHVKVQYLESDFAELFCRGLAGLDPDGLENAAFRGRFPGRNAAMGRLVLGTGMRSREFTHLLVHEVPPLPAEPTEVPILWAVPELGAKGRKFRTTWIDYASLAAVHAYIALDREMARGSWMPRKPLVVEEADFRGGRVNGRRMTWSSLAPAERLRLVDPQGGSLLLALSYGGRPFVDWGTLFRRTARRIREVFEPRFPDVAPHRCRHSFAMATLERLVEGHYRAAAQMAAATGDASGLALYLLKSDPLLILRDLLGHSSVTTTEVYLKRLDVHRIYQAAWEKTHGQVDPAVLAEADSEFEETV
ncbi:site-specific integrase [Actinacidiphila paucisporea]|uniref:site-specific integrase n=1 Tax=Actinacidiphila paucisporea TaxID=310782 RepID=UPI000936581A|nr:site-specific integrase [Actinacidiphila paucisporea]